jgi:hypothetical protein
MRLPFSIEQFLSVFESYNLAIWPMQIAAYLLGILAIFLLFRPNKYSSRIVAAILALFWLWNGVPYHIAYFSAINRAAYLFGLLFVIQGILFAIYGLIKKTLEFKFAPDAPSLVGLVIIAYSILIYPLLGTALGHVYPRSPVFGVAPCPMTIFTFGVLVMARVRLPVVLMIIPFLWSLIGFSAAVSLGIREDIGLLVAGLLSAPIALVKNRKLVSPAS